MIATQSCSSGEYSDVSDDEHDVWKQKLIESVEDDEDDYIMHFQELKELTPSLIVHFQFAPTKCHNIRNMPTSGRTKQNTIKQMELIIKHVINQSISHVVKAMNLASESQSQSKDQYSDKDVCLVFAQLYILMFYETDVKIFYLNCTQGWMRSYVLPKNKYEKMCNVFHPYDEEKYSYDKNDANGKPYHSSWLGLPFG
jgi:hypothetical protein